MIQNVIPSINILLSIVLLYLFKVYGALVWWWVHLQREAHFAINTIPSFILLVDQLHVIVIVISILNLFNTIYYWRTRVVQTALSKVAVVIAFCTLMICLFISV
jgi:hypothetical protein